MTLEVALLTTGQISNCFSWVFFYVKCYVKISIIASLQKAPLLESNI